MKKIVVLLAAILIRACVFAATGPPNANEIFIPIADNGQQISLLALSQISIRHFELVTGKKMGIGGKIFFKITQNKLRHLINDDGTINVNRSDIITEAFRADTGAALGGFALGFWGSIIGVLIAYSIEDNKKRKRVTWAWVGFSLSALFLIAYLLG